MYYSKLQQETDEEFSLQSKLTRSYEKVQESINELKNKEKALRDALVQMSSQEKQLEEWEVKAVGTKDDDPEKRLVPFDVASEQLVKIQAEYAAIEDTMYWLETAICSGDAKGATIDLATFLKETRNLAKQQFLNKVHIDKIKRKIESGGGGGGGIR